MRKKRRGDEERLCTKIGIRRNKTTKKHKETRKRVNYLVLLRVFSWFHLLNLNFCAKLNKPVSVVMKSKYFSANIKIDLNQNHPDFI